MNYSITLLTLDKQTIQFNCKAQQSLLDAAEKVGFFPPAICKMGNCRACIAVCDEGEYQLKNCSAGVLREDAEEMGDILLCRTFPQSDLMIYVPYNADRIQYREPE